LAKRSIDLLSSAKNTSKSKRWIRMNIIKILLLIGILALAYPRTRKDSGTEAPEKKEKGAFIALSVACVALGIMHQMDLFPAIADLMDDVMEVFFHFAGGKSV
jgi:hypothetical protein